MMDLRTAIAVVAAAVSIQAAAASQVTPQRVGSWGYVAIPLPPGGTLATNPVRPDAAGSTPLGAVVTNTFRAQPTVLIENPGGVPVRNVATEISNVTVRQLARVSVGGRRLRLRFSNEAGAESLSLGAIHVGKSGPDGTILPGTDRVVIFAGQGSVIIPQSSPVLSVPGVKVILLLEGINDIGTGFTTMSGVAPVTLEAMQAADRQIIERAHEHGIRAIGATLTPYHGAQYATPQGEAVRQALHQWIKTSGAFDGVVDIAAAVADPANPLAIDERYNIRDKLHPNDAGYKAMADAIDLMLITGR